MNRQKIWKVISKFTLLIVEYSSKMFAYIAVAIVFGTPGVYSDKVVSAFSSLPAVFFQILKAPNQIAHLATVINDFSFSSQQVGDFGNITGINPLNSALIELNPAAEYVIRVGHNFSINPLPTLAAAASVFSSFFLVSFIFGFIRRRGRDTYRFQIEQAIWYKFFDRTRTKKTTRKAVDLNTSRKSQMRINFPEEMLKKTESDQNKQASSEQISQMIPSDDKQEKKRAETEEVKVTSLVLYQGRTQDETEEDESGEKIREEKKLQPTVTLLEDTKTQEQELLLKDEKVVEKQVQDQEEDDNLVDMDTPIRKEPMTLNNILKMARS